MKKIDPTERALDAYFQLDTDQMAEFNRAVKHVDRLVRDANRFAAPVAPKPLGRPKGSRNRKPDVLTPSAQELDLRHNNGAATEGL